MRFVSVIGVSVLALLCLAAIAPAQDPSLLKGIENVFDRPAELAKATGPIVCILDTEHPDTVKKKITEKPIPEYKCRVLQRRMREVSGLPCILVHHAEITRKDFERPNIKAILLMARAKTINAELDKELFALIRETKIPMIGFCGGLQMIVQAYGGRIDYMRKLKPGETDTNPKYQPGWFKEWGFMPVRVTKQDPLFANLPNPLVVKEMHAWQITHLPQEFEILGSTDECKVEIAKHRERPLYGTQFHPEAYDDQHQDGKNLLANFFRIAGVDLPNAPAQRSKRLGR